MPKGKGYPGGEPFKHRSTKTAGTVRATSSKVGSHGSSRKASKVSPKKKGY